MKTNSYSQLAGAARSGGSVRSDNFESMIEERNRQRLRLTPRELDVLRLLCEGLPNKLIERRLGIGAGTVKCHVASILSKLGVASRLQAVVAAHRLGLIETAGGEAGGGESESMRDYKLAPEGGSLDGSVRLSLI